MADTSEQARRKYFAYRYVWPKRNQKTPSGLKTWAQWWNMKFKGDIEKYHSELRKLKG